MHAASAGPIASRARRGRLLSSLLALAFLATPLPAAPPGPAAKLEGTAYLEQIEKLARGPLRSGGIYLRFVWVEGREPNPSLTELSVLDPHLGPLGRLDYEGGIARELGYLHWMTPGAALHIFVVDWPDTRVAAFTRTVPIPGRVDRAPRRLKMRCLDGKTVALQEPLPSLVIPRRLLHGEPAGRLASTLKHEIGHVLQDRIARMIAKGYRESFWNHTAHVRTNDSSALAEGFAQYAAYRFRDSDREGKPGPVREVLRRNNNSAYRTLLISYWIHLRGHAERHKQLSHAELSGAERRIMRTLWRPELPTPDQFRELIVEILRDRGSPPLDAERLKRSLVAYEANHPDGVANLRDEELSRKEMRDWVVGFFKRAAKGIRPAPAAALATSATAAAANRPASAVIDPAAVRDARAFSDEFWRRSPLDLMITEGLVTALLLALDRELSSPRLDFFSRVLEAMALDPYDGRSLPPQPVNIRELLSMLERAPDLTGKVFPIVASLTDGALTAGDFTLRKTRELDPLHTARPGGQPTLEAAPRTPVTSSIGPFDG